MQEHIPFLPHGFQFRPSNEELVEHYLKKKVLGILIPLTEYFIRDCNLYETKPSEIWDSHGGPFLNADEDMYFFTQLKKKSSKGSRIDRKVGSSGGAWQGEDAGKDIVSGQSKIKIGSKNQFRYEKKGSEDHGAWIMHEYTLDLPKNQATNYVLCRLRKNQPTGQDKKYGSAKKRKLNYIQHNNNQSEQVTDTEVERVLTHQENQQQNYVHYQEVSCSSTGMMNEQSLSGGMGFASSVIEHSSVTDQMQQHQSEQVTNIEVERVLTHQQNQQQNYVHYQEVSCSSTDMMNGQSLSGGMGFVSSVAEHSGVIDQLHKHQCQQILVQNSECHYEPSMEIMMSHFDKMLSHQQRDSGNNLLQSGETGGETLAISSDYESSIDYEWESIHQLLQSDLVLDLEDILS